MKYSELLVTTPIEETWALKDSKKLIFLGENCKTYSNKRLRIDINNKTLKDPWSNRGSRKFFFENAEKIYERALEYIHINLNKYHGTNKSKIYWQILVGPWLKIFINSTYHPWEVIKDLKNSDWNGKTIAINNLEETQKSYDIYDFYKKRLAHAWNHHLCCQIIEEFYGSEIFDHIEKPQKLFVEEKFEDESSTHFMKNNTKRFINLLSQKLNNSSYFFHKTYLTKYHQIALAMKLRVMPFFSKESIRLKESTYDESLRDSLSSSSKYNTPDPFENFLFSKIFKYIPINYLEGYIESKNYLISRKWPENPKFIVTANSHWIDDIFKLYAAEKVENGSKLKLIIHGGHGKAAYSDFENHEIKISNKIFSWGWEEYSTKIIKGFYIKNKLKNSPKDHALQVLFSEWPYQILFKSTPSYEQFIKNHIPEQLEFISNLSSHIRNKLLIKPADKNNSFEEMISEKFNDVNFVYQEKSFNELIKTSKVVIHSYNETPIVETLANNIPTISFWNQDHWEQCPSSIKIYDLLKEAKIFHPSPRSAALHLNNIWDNVDEWWNDVKVQEAVKEHNDWFARKTEKPIKELIKFIKS